MGFDKGEWCNLGSKPRHENLSKMRPLGIWEQRMMGKVHTITEQVATNLPLAENGDEKIININGENEIMTVRKNGICELCGKEDGAVKKVIGKICCATCEGIRRNTRIRGNLVLEQLQEFHPNLLSSLPPDRDDNDRQPLNAELASSNIRLVQECRDMEDKNLILQGELDGLKDVLAAGETERSSLLTEHDRLIEEVRLLNEKLTAAENNADEQNEEINHQLLADILSIQEDFAAPVTILTETQLAISDICDSLRDMLIDKNRSYGNSALEPLRVLSKASTQEQILVRIDDKLSRLSKGIDFHCDDTVMDLTGYLVLLMVHREQSIEMV